MASKSSKRRSVNGQMSLGGLKGKQASTSDATPTTATGSEHEFSLGPPLAEQERLDELLQLKEPESVAEALAELLSLNDHQCSMKEACLLDCYVTTVAFCQEEKFPSWLTSAVLTTLRSFLDRIAEKASTESKVFAHFRSIMVELVTFASHQEEVRELDVTLKKVVEHFRRTVIQHLRLFQLLFSDEARENEVITHGMQLTCPHPIDAPPVLFPPPLDDGLEHDLWLLTQPREEEEEDEEREPDEEEEVAKADSETVKALMADIPTKRIEELTKMVAMELLEPFRTSIEQKMEDKQAAYRKKIAALRPEKS